jgi:hypothetical protein
MKSHLIKGFPALLIIGLLGMTSSCYVTRNLTQHDLEYENRKDNVSSWTVHCGIRSSGRIKSYTTNEGKEVLLPSVPGDLKIQKAYVKDDSLYLMLVGRGGPVTEIHQAIPRSEIKYLKVKRFHKKATLWIIAGSTLLAWELVLFL